MSVKHDAREIFRQPVLQIKTNISRHYVQSAPTCREAVDSDHVPCTLLLLRVAPCLSFCLPLSYLRFLEERTHKLLRARISKLLLHHLNAAPNSARGEKHAQQAALNVTLPLGVVEESACHQD